MAEIISFDGCSDQPETPPKPRRRFQPIPAHEFATLEPATWIIKKVIPKSELVVIFGPSQSGKTFLTLDLLMCICRGEPWFGHKVKKGRVVYIAAESSRGVKKRLISYCKYHGLNLKDYEIDIVPDCPNLLNDIDTKLMAAEIKDASVIVIDTYARAMAGGNENDSEDGGKAIAECQRLHQKTGALIILVHHTGKNAEAGARGWSGLKAAADTEISVEKIDNNHVATITKQKDDESGEKFGFWLHSLTVGIDEDGEPVTSCVVMPLDEAPVKQSEKDKGMGKWQRYAMRAFDALKGTFDGGQVHVENLITATADKGLPPEPGKEDRRRDAGRRAVEALIEEGKLVRNGDFVVKVKVK